MQATSTARKLQEKPVHTVAGTGHATFDGSSSLTTPDSPALSITGDISIATRIIPTSWTSGLTIVGKYAPGSSWYLELTSALGAPRLHLTWYEDGTPGTQHIAISNVLSALMMNSGPVWVAATLDVDNGEGWYEGRFWWSVDGASWTNMGVSSGPGATTIYDSTSPLTIGEFFEGDISDVVLWNGIGAGGVPGGTEVFRLQGIDIPSASATTFPATSGQTVTVNGATLVPTERRGMPTGSGDWRLVIERLGTTGAVVGVDEVGTAVVGSLQWEDITPYWRGYNARRGAQERLGRPMVGEITLTLDARNNDTFDPYIDAVNTRPGTVVRAGLVSATDPRCNGWLPRWTGLVETWPPTYVQGADVYAEVRLTETLSSITMIDDNALPGVVGAGEKVTARIDRLLTNAQWRFGLVSLFGPTFGEPNITLQSTDMALNRSAEVYLTADSTTSVVRSDVTGAVLVTDRANDRATRLGEFSTIDFGAGPIPVLLMQKLSDSTPNLPSSAWRVGYDHDSVVTDTSPIALVNDHRYGRVGGTQQVFQHKVSQGVFRTKRTRKRTDLLCQLDAQALYVAQADSDREARTTLDIAAVTITATGKAGRLLAVAAVDIGDLVWLYPPAAQGWDGNVFGNVRSIIEDVRPLYGRVAWTTTYALDLSVIQGVPGAMLDPAPR